MTAGSMDASERGTAARIALARALFPDLAAELDAALVRSGGGGVIDALDAQLDAGAAALLPHAAFADVAEPEGAHRAERNFAAARLAAGWLGIAVPEPESFAAAGVDLARLGTALAADPALTAVPAPFGLGPERWVEAFGRAADEMASAGAGASLERDAEGASPLVLATEAQRDFAILDTVPPSAPAVADGDARWALRLVPAGERPPVLGLAYAHGSHVAMPEMLMLQLMRAAAGLSLVDAASFTWLEGAVAGGRLAARHVYDLSERAIRITCREPGNQGPHLGARTPIA